MSQLSNLRIGTTQAVANGLGVLAMLAHEKRFSQRAPRTEASLARVHAG